MHFYLVSPSSRVHAEDSFTYHSENVVAIGTVVMVEVGKIHLPAVVIAKTTQPKFSTKPISDIIEPTALPQPLLSLASWMRAYYNAPLPTVWQTILPRGVQSKRRNHDVSLPQQTRKIQSFTLTKEQKHAINTIEKSPSKTHLLQGVTGSGKTAIYIELAKTVIFKQQKSVIVLVPEIALTSQLISEFQHHFQQILVTHSGMTDAQRHVVWQKALRAEQPHIVIGPRSALFTPLKEVGLIVIDEAHETSFKQEQTPRYSALRAARVLTDKHQGTLVIGSATPSVTDRYLAEQNNNLITLTKPAKDIGKIDITLVDNRNKANFTQHRFLSKTLIDTIQDTLDNKQQVLLFHNRRGSASVTLCENCGWSAICDHCFVPLVLHTDQHKLICHVCGRKHSIPTSCPQCSHTGVIHKGIGTKTISEAVEKLFPKAKVARFDADTHKDVTLDKIYKDIYKGNIDIIIGTQVVAKGLDLPQLATVGVVQADGGLILPDFAAEERVFQLLVQVMGRVGRDKKLSKIVVQTYQPESKLIQSAIARDYESFYEHTIQKRRHDNFPPFTHLLKATCTYKTEAGAAKAARELKQKLLSKSDNTIEILGPSPAFYERAYGAYRWQIIIKSPSRAKLLDLAQHIPDTKWQVELDPISLL